MKALKRLSARAYKCANLNKIFEVTVDDLEVTVDDLEVTIVNAEWHYCGYITG